ncbi:PKD domain-containing protein [Spongiivirga sp. MCCC 1A20706]|uniref:PKD domain-containing protein n=1 Tax=Spongiivirga sp. MCCC 1A20706 TaxID=3160963 RepID=UPI0039775D18
MNNLFQQFKRISLFILVFTIFGCNEDDTNNLPKIVSGFTFTLNEDTGTVKFINISEEATAYEWDFGDGTSSTEINPIKTYETGTYTVALKAMNVAGASDTFEDEITISIPEGVMLPITFDSSNVNYNAGTFGGASFEVVDNPAPGGTNDVASQVGAITNIGAAFEGIFFNVVSSIDLTTEKTIKMNFWSESAINVLLKLEEGSAASVETVASHGGSGWEEIQFSFTESASYERLTLFVDGPGTTPGTFYIDDIQQTETMTGGGGSLDACDGGELVNDFETADDGIFNNFGGGVGTIIDNPDTSVNTSAKIGQYVKNAGEVFGGITIEVDPDIDFNAGVFSIDVNSQAVRQLLFKLEGLNIEVVVPTSGMGWETITYDFSTVANNIGSATAITLIMDNGTAGDGSADWTIQFDNIRLCSNESTGGGNSLEDCGGDLVNDFETADDSIFNNFGGGVGTIIDNPDTSVNTSAKIGQYVKNAGEVFGGITIEVDPDINFNAGVFSIDVNSQAVRQLLFKLEGLNIEVVVPTSGMGWETITYDFSTVANNMGSATAITLIMDNGTAGDGSADWTIQFDNIRLCSNGSTGGGNSLEDCGGDLVNDFETADDSIFNNFGGGVGTIIDNPDTSVNTSAKIGQYVKNAGEVFGGVTIEVDPDINFNAGVFSIDVNSQAARQLLFKLEGLNIEVVVPTSGMGWETITYDFSTVANNMGSATAITLIMDNGTAGDGSADWTIQFDNIRLCSNGSTGGGGGCPAPPMGELLSNGGFEANSGDGACWQLNAGGGAVTVIDTDANTGTYSARLTTGPAQVPNLKQERFAASVAGNQNIQVTFKYKITSAFVDGSILQVLAFSERSANGAVQHDLGNAGTSTVDVWETYTGTFTTDAAIDEGISLLIQATCGGAATCAGEVLIDDVVVTEI